MRVRLIDLGLEAVLMPGNYTDAMLCSIIEHAQRALAIADPLDRAAVISGEIQPHMGWALRWAIEDCRAQGLTWQEIAARLGRSYPALLRQVEAGGPVYTARAAQSPGTRNYDGQTPLRRAATALVQQMTALGMQRPDTLTYAHLHQAVTSLGDAQGVIDNPAPLLQATRDLLALAGRLRPYALPSDVQPVLVIWDLLDKLKACYERDQGQIEAAHTIQQATENPPAAVRLSLDQMAADTRSSLQPG